MRKTLWISIYLFLFSLQAYAQRPGQQFDRQKLEDAKIAFISTRLDLSPEQAQKFWPLYNQYSNQREANLRKLAELNPRREANSISDSQAKEMIAKRFAIQRQMIDDEEKFVKEVASVISYEQILKLNGISRDFTRMLYQRQRGRNQH